MEFDSLGLSAPILNAVRDQGYTTPSPIQAKAIPAVLQGNDLMAAAQTGTGKTAGFTLPILELIHKGPRPNSKQARVLILTPTRELAAQIDENVKAYSKYLRLNSAVVFGGVNIKPQISKLRGGLDVLVATPGRLLDLYNQKAVRFDDLEILVLDEADRMLDMGFIHDIKRILKTLPPKRQNLLFSATFSDEIRKLAKGLVNNPVEISVTPRNAAADTVDQWIYEVEQKQKSAFLSFLIQLNDWDQVLVFSRTKHGANRISEYLGKRGITSAAIHGNKSQGARTKALASFKDGSVRVLVATDIAARGIDISQLPNVVNFDLPNVPQDYVHRIGRTGRAGSEGQAVSLVSRDESKLLRDIERLIKKKLEVKELEGYVPPEIPQQQQERKTDNRPKPNNRSKDGGGSNDNRSKSKKPKKRKFFPRS